MKKLGLLGVIHAMMRMNRRLEQSLSWPTFTLWCFFLISKILWSRTPKCVIDRSFSEGPGMGDKVPTWNPTVIPFADYLSNVTELNHVWLLTKFWFSKAT